MSDYGCSDSIKNQIQTVDGLSIQEANQNVHFDECYGFICLNKEQKINETCLDYQIRQCCPINVSTQSGIETSTAVTTETTSPTTTATTTTITTTTTTTTTTATTTTTSPTTQTTTVSLPECPYNIEFENTEILTVNESEKFIELSVFADKNIDCQFKKTFIVEVEYKSFTAKRGVDFDR